MYVVENTLWGEWQFAHEQAQRNSVTQRNTNCHAAPEGTITTFITTQPRSAAPNTPTETQHQPLASQCPLYRLAPILHVQKCARVAQGVVPAAGVTMGGGGVTEHCTTNRERF